MKQSGVYKLNNILTGDFYIGASKNIRSRWQTHCWRAANDWRSDSLLYDAIRAHGVENFKLEVIEECEPDKDLLLEREQYYVDALKPAYNILTNVREIPMGNRGNHDFRHTEESKLMQSQIHKELRAKRIQERGYYVSPEGTEIAKAKRNAHFTPERRQQYSEETTDARALAEKARKQAADKVAQQFLPMILEMQREGMALTEIAKQMNAKGFRTRRGSAWTDQTVRQMLKRRPKPVLPTRGINTEVIGKSQPARADTMNRVQVPFIGWKNIS